MNFDINKNKRWAKYGAGFFFFYILMFGCGRPDLDDTAILNEIVSEAIEEGSLQMQVWTGEELPYAPGEQEPYSGWVKVFYGDGSLQKLVQLYDGKLDGFSLEWYNNGQKKCEGDYKNAKQDGPWTSWHENGKKSRQAIFKQDRPEGRTEEWYENGQKKTEANWRDGRLNGTTNRWYKNGLKKDEVFLKNGIPHGLSTRWYENGQMRSKGETMAFINDGQNLNWYENGQMHTEVNYKSGKLISAFVWKPNGEKCPVSNLKDGDGIMISYNEDGTERSRTTFKSGERVEVTQSSFNSNESEFERKNRLAEGGDKIAQFNLGLMYENGDGIPQDYSSESPSRKMSWLSIRALHLKEAEKWYIKSAKKGNSNAMFNLGVMYHNEKLPKDNPYIAYAWFSVAKENGHELAERNLDILKAKMTKVQMDKANSLSTEIYNDIEANRIN